MTEHAFLAPSSAHRWVVCAASPMMEARYPEKEPSPESMEGAAAHWAAEMLLRGTPATLGQAAPNGVLITQAMLEGAELVRDDVRAVTKDVLMEYRVRAKRVHPTDNWGTPDYHAATMMVNGNLCLHIWDYKFGCRTVEAFENWQLINYAAGVLDEMGIEGLQEQTFVVDLRVIQPRAYRAEGPVRSWRVLASDLRGYVNRLALQARLATSPEPPFDASNPDACRDCKGRHACQALQRAGYAAADQGKHCLPLELPADALGLELHTLTRERALLDARISGLEEDAQARIKRGERVPFFRLEQSSGKLAWIVPPTEVIAMGQMFGQDLSKPADAITPTQAGKKGVPEAVISLYARRPLGALQLVHDDGTKARLTFSSGVA